MAVMSVRSSENISLATMVMIISVVINERIASREEGAVIVLARHT